MPKSYEQPDGTWYISFPASYVGREGYPGMGSEGIGSYVELTNNYTTIAYGHLRLLKKDKIEEIHTFSSSIKEYVVKLSELLPALSELNRLTAMNFMYVARVLFNTLKLYSNDSNHLHKKEIDEKERNIQELTRQLSLLRVEILQHQYEEEITRDESSRLITRLRKELDEQKIIIKSLVTQNDCLILREEVLKERWDKKIKLLTTPVQVYPTYEQELETACRRAKNMARQQKEAKERLMMLQHDYNTIDSVGSIMISIQ